MTSTTFRAISVSASERLQEPSEASGKPSRSSLLHYNTELEQGSSIKLASGGEFTGTRGHFTLVPDTVEKSPDMKSEIGYMQHWPESGGGDDVEPETEAFGVTLWLPKEQIDLLLNAAMVGHIPSSINLGFNDEAIKFDWMPDGSGLIWDNVSHRFAPISSVDFSLSLVPEPTNFPDELEDISVISGPAHLQLHELSIKLAQSGLLLRRLATRLDLIAVSIVALVVIVLWRL